MVHVHDICHKNYALRCAGGVLELRKIDFRGLKDTFDVKKTNFRGPIAKMGYFRPFLVSRAQL